MTELAAPFTVLKASTMHGTSLISSASNAAERGTRSPSGISSRVVHGRPSSRRLAHHASLYGEAWWAKRRDEGRPWTTREDIPEGERVPRSAALLAEEIKDVPCIVLAFSTVKGAASSVIPPAQNLMLAARALGIGSVPTTLHACVMERVYQLLGVPPEVDFHLCIPLGYPR